MKRVIDWCVHDFVGDGGAAAGERMRARVLAGGSAAGLAVCVAFFFHRLWIDRGLGMGGATMIASALVFAAPMLLLRHGVSLRLAGAVVPVALLVLLPFDAWHNGGLASASLTAMLPVPLIAGFFLGARASISFAAALAVETIALVALVTLGVRAPPPPDPASAASAHAVAVVALLFFVGGLALLFDRERSLAFDSLARSERRYALAAKETNDGFFEWGGDQAVLVSERLLDLLGLPTDRPRLDAAELIERIVEVDREEVITAIERSRAGRGRGEMEVRWKRVDGTVRWAHVLMHPVDGQPGGPRSVIGTIRDATASKRLDALKSDFVSAVSHELRTPLTSIRGAVALLGSDSVAPLPGAAKDVLAIAGRNVDRLLRIVDDLLDMQRLEAGALELTLERVALERVVRDAASATASMSDTSGATIDVIVPDEPTLVRADATRLGQVITNLLSNAIKVSPPRGVVRLVVTKSANDARVDVMDEGPGVPEDFRHRIFGKFAQAGSGEARSDRGTGLGLAISKAIVERHGGRIGYANLDRGARFSVVLPVDDRPPAA